MSIHSHVPKFCTQSLKYLHPFECQLILLDQPLADTLSTILIGSGIFLNLWTLKVQHPPTYHIHIIILLAIFTRPNRHSASKACTTATASVTSWQPQSQTAPTVSSPTLNTSAPPGCSSVTLSSGSRALDTVRIFLIHNEYHYNGSQWQ